MEECLAIKPDLVFLWDEAWFACRFSPLYRPAHGDGARAALKEAFADPAYWSDTSRRKSNSAESGSQDKRLLEARLIPDRARRSSGSTDELDAQSMSALRQGSMVLGGRRGTTCCTSKPSRRRCSPTPRLLPPATHARRWTSRAGRWSWKATIGDAAITLPSRSAAR